MLLCAARHIACAIWGPDEMTDASPLAHAQRARLFAQPLVCVGLGGGRATGMSTGRLLCPACAALGKRTGCEKRGTPGPGLNNEEMEVHWLIQSHFTSQLLELSHLPLPFTPFPVRLIVLLLIPPPQLLSRLQDRPAAHEQYLWRRALKAQGPERPPVVRRHEEGRVCGCVRPGSVVVGAPHIAALRWWCRNRLCHGRRAVDDAGPGRRGRGERSCSGG